MPETKTGAPMCSSAGTSHSALRGPAMLWLPRRITGRCARPSRCAARRCARPRVWVGGPRWRHRVGDRGRRGTDTDPQPQVGLHGAFSGRVSQVGGSVPLADQRFVVEQVDRELHEHRPGHPRFGRPERLFEGGHDVADAPNRARPCDVRRASRVIWSMSCSAPRPCRAVGAAPATTITGDWASWAFLTAVIVFVTPGPAVTAATPGRPVSRATGVGGEDGGGLVPGVDDPDPEGLGADQHAVRCAAAQGEQEPNALRPQDLGHQVSAVHACPPSDGPIVVVPAGAPSGCLSRMGPPDGHQHTCVHQHTGVPSPGLSRCSASGRVLGARVGGHRYIASSRSR